MRTGPGFLEHHVLADGAKVTVRHIADGDADELRRAFSTLSPETRYRRFLWDVSTLDDSMVRYFTHVDGHDHVAFVAVGDSPDMKSDVGYGVARFVRLAGEPDAAEAAVTVVDALQNRGVGHLLLHTLAEAARERGIRRFRGEVLAANGPVRQLLAEAGAVVQRETPESITFDIALDRDDLPLARWLRLAADRLSALPGLHALHDLAPR